MHDAQISQERQYSFPYHHIAHFSGGFRTSYFLKYGLKHAASLDWILQQIGQLNPATVLDVGCGDGRLVRELDRSLPNAEVVGIDYSQRSIHLAKGMHPDGNFTKVNILEDDFPNTFDLLTLIEVFEHIPLDQCEVFARRLGQMVHPGGHLMITVPHKNLSLSDKHFQHFTASSLRAFFQKDFEVRQVQFLEKRSDWRMYIYYRLLKNKLFILNNQPILDWIFRGYKKHLLHAGVEKDCERIYMLLTRK